KDGSAYAVGTTGTVAFTPDDGGVYEITLTVADDDRGRDSVTRTIAVDNVAPTVAVSGPAGGVRGQSRVFTFAADDPAPRDREAGFTFLVSWGDGHTEQVHGASPVSLAHMYAAAGTYTVTVTGTDKDGGAGSASTTITIAAAELQGDTLYVGGTTGADD